MGYFSRMDLEYRDNPYEEDENMGDESFNPNREYYDKYTDDYEEVEDE